MQWTLYTSPRSPFARKVVIAAHETGLVDRIVLQNVVTTPMVPAAEVRAHNPLGMIPTLLIGSGEMLYDSLVILDFLQEESGVPLIPAAGAARRDCLTRHAVANGVMEKAVKMLDETFRTQNADTADHMKGYVASVLESLNWLSGRTRQDRFDAGDIALASALAYLDMRFPDLLWQGQVPELADWYRNISQRPSVSATAVQPAPVTPRP